MLVDGFDDVWVGIEALAVVLPEVARGQQEAAVLREQIAQLPEAGQQVCHLQANLLQAPDPGAERQTQGSGTEPRQSFRRGASQGPASGVTALPPHSWELDLALPGAVHRLQNSISIPWVLPDHTALTPQSSLVPHFHFHV